jgi:hypothetical protein
VVSDAHDSFQWLHKHADFITTLLILMRVHGLWHEGKPLIGFMCPIVPQITIPLEEILIKRNIHQGWGEEYAIT